MKTLLKCKFIGLLTVVCVSLISNDSFSQSEIITFPANGSIFQKNTSGNHHFYFAGQLKTNAQIYYSLEEKTGSSWDQLEQFFQFLRFVMFHNTRNYFYIPQLLHLILELFRLFVLTAKKAFFWISLT